MEAKALRERRLYIRRLPAPEGPEVTLGPASAAHWPAGLPLSRRCLVPGSAWAGSAGNSSPPSCGLGVRGRSVGRPVPLGGRRRWVFSRGFLEIGAGCPTSRILLRKSFATLRAMPALGWVLRRVWRGWRPLLGWPACWRFAFCAVTAMGELLGRANRAGNEKLRICVRDAQPSFRRIFF